MFAWKIPAVVLLIGSCLHGYAAAVDTGATEVKFRGFLLDTNPCTVVGNNGDNIAVKFERVNRNEADGQKIMKKIDFSVKCTGDNQDNGLKMQIIGTPSFADNVLKTDKDNLGIIFYQNNKVVELHQWFDLPVPANSLELTASPIVNKGSDVADGPFNATATLLVSIL